MVTEIRIYIEGGGDGSETKAALRRGFHGFFKPFIEAARKRRIRWTHLPRGKRGSTFSDFQTALRTHPTAFNILLVDSEAPVALTPWQHLNQRDNWANPGATDEQCHLMVQAMESWFIADIESLKQFYGDQFNPNPIPKNPDVELIDKDRLEPALLDATRLCVSKGRYHKIRHASLILPMLNLDIIRKKSIHAKRFFETLENLIHS